MRCAWARICARHGRRRSKPCCCRNAVDVVDVRVQFVALRIFFKECRGAVVLLDQAHQGDADFHAAAGSSRACGPRAGAGCAKTRQYPAFRGRSIRRPIAAAHIADGKVHGAGAVFHLAQARGGLLQEAVEDGECGVVVALLRWHYVGVADAAAAGGRAVNGFAAQCVVACARPRCRPRPGATAPRGRRRIARRC